MSEHIEYPTDDKLREEAINLYRELHFRNYLDKPMPGGHIDSRSLRQVQLELAREIDMWEKYRHDTEEIFQKTYFARREEDPLHPYKTYQEAVILQLRVLEYLQAHLTDIHEYVIEHWQETPESTESPESPESQQAPILLTRKKTKDRTSDISPDLN